MSISTGPTRSGEGSPTIAGAELTRRDRQRLLRLARATLEAHLGRRAPAAASQRAVRAPGRGVRDDPGGGRAPRLSRSPRGRPAARRDRARHDGRRGAGRSPLRAGHGGGAARADARDLGVAPARPIRACRSRPPRDRPGWADRAARASHGAAVAAGGGRARLGRRTLPRSLLPQGGPLARRVAGTRHRRPHVSGGSLRRTRARDRGTGRARGKGEGEVIPRIVSTPIAPLVLPPGPGKPRRVEPDVIAAALPGPGRDRLAAGEVLAVTTGQQPGLFTGPLYTIYKGLSAVALARRLERDWKIPIVPVFWVAGDDHDFAEANHAWVLDRSGEPARIVLRERPPDAPLVPLWRGPRADESTAGPEDPRAETPRREFEGWGGGRLGPGAPPPTRPPGARRP